MSIPPIDERCLDCNGRGTWLMIKPEVKEVPCPTCKGSGRS